MGPEEARHMVIAKIAETAKTSPKLPMLHRPPFNFRDDDALRDSNSGDFWQSLAILGIAAM
jgi:hypothetical protein